jgi:hypothetical protein
MLRFSAVLSRVAVTAQQLCRHNTVTCTGWRQAEVDSHHCAHPSCFCRVIRHAAAPLLLPLLSLCRYEVEAMYFDSHVRAEHYDKLLEALQEQLEPSFSTQLRLLAAEQLAGFDKDLTVALVEQPQGFSSAAERAATAALQGFDSRAAEYVVAGTDLTGGCAPVRRVRLHMQQLGRLVLE